MAERKRGFTKPRGELPSSVQFVGIVYNDTDDPRFRYVFTRPRACLVEISNEEGTWTQAYSFYLGRRQGWSAALESARGSAASALVSGFEQLMIACAIDATGGSDTAHYESGDNATLCGITTAWGTRVRVRNTTPNVLKITCKECRFKIINTVNAMPFLGPEPESE